LPSYPFEPVHYPVNKELFKPGNPSIPSSFAKENSHKKTNETGWFYIPSWERSTLPPLPPSLPIDQKQTILVFSDEKIGPQLIQQLEQNGANVITVQMGTINPAAKESYDDLWQHLETQGQIPSQVYHLWSISQEHNDKTRPDNINENLTHGFYSVLCLVQAIAKQNSTKDHEICLNIITAGACEVTGNEELNPAGASIHALCRTIRQEFPDLTCRCIDISFPIPPIEILLEEFSANSWEPTVAYRGEYRWVESFKPLRLEKPPRENLPLKEKGVYLITGGLGTIGMTLAEYLAKTYHARLILTGRSQVHTGKNQRLLAMEAAGAEVLVLNANAADRQQMQNVFQQAEARFGQINGIIHAAGNVGEKFLSPLKDMDKPEVQLHFEAKIYGVLTLAELLKNNPMDFCLLLSSTSSILGGLGFAAYAAANRFMDTYIYYLNRTSRTHWISLNYDSWQLEETKIAGKVLSAEIKEMAITPNEGIEIFERVLSWPRANQVIGCTGDLQPRIDRWVKLQGLHTPLTPDQEKTPGTQEEKSVPLSRRARPSLAIPYIQPQSPREKETAAIWEELLGYEPIGLQDNFFELNGDSLKAVITISKIHRKTGVKVPLKDFFTNPTIAGIVQYIEGAKRDTFYTIDPIEKKEYYPLSSAQKRLYIFQQLHPESTAYNIPALHRLTGNFDIEKFRGIFITIMQRHEALRTAFLTINGEIVQTIAGSSDFTMTYWELAEAEALSRIPTLFKPFDLGQAPLLRVGLIKVQAQNYIIFIDIHHIISDRGSMDILIDNIFRLYQGQNLTPLHIQYKDYVARLDKQRKDETTEAREKYWLNHLKGLAFTKLPMDYLKPNDKVIGRAFNQEIEPSLYRQIDNFCVKHNVTKFIFLITVLQITLTRKLEQWDIALGIPASLRDHADLKEVIGIFLNVLVIRTIIDYNETFLNQLTKSKNIITGALDNQDYPYERLIDKIKARDTQTAPNELFSILFNYFQVYQDQKSNFPGFQIQQMEMPEISPKYDITFYGYEGVNQLEISIVYKSNMYSEDTIKKLSTDFLATLQNALENENMSIAQITTWNRSDNDDWNEGSDIDQYYN
ncbi:MAG: SDR family NAD(P)-dependent oxidoreductase, partial [Acidobacteria bacterium]|nr:SDR family NAD(P)-dependent oxidoreductase [Acidobacteriota bacterium]